MNSENKENTLKLWSHLSKEEYLRILKEKTYDYNMTNTYAANQFLSKIQDDQIFVYYTGKDIVAKGGFKGFEAYIKECENGTMIEGKFVPARHFLKLIRFPFLIVMWIGMLWFTIKAPFMGIIVIPLGVIVTMILYMIDKISYEKDYYEEVIVEFLVNLHTK